MSIFAVGEIVVIAKSTWPQYPVGMEVTIESVGYGFVFIPEPTCSCCGGHAYGLVGLMVYGCDGTLRKRRPPQDWKSLCRLDEVPSDCVSEPEVVT